MNRIPGLLVLILILALCIRYLPRFWKGFNAVFRYAAFPFCILVILYLTVFSRFLSPRAIYNMIFNMGFQPTDTVTLGERGSEWLAGKQGVTGLSLLRIGLSDPNSRLYIIPSCLMNLLLFMPVGMLLRFTGAAHVNRRDRFWVCICAGFVLIIECIQFLTGLGKFDLLDILFNTAGFYLGLKLYDRYLKNG